MDKNKERERERHFVSPFATLLFPVRLHRNPIADPFLCRNIELPFVHSAVFPFIFPYNVISIRNNAFRTILLCVYCSVIYRTRILGVYRGRRAQ